MEQLNFDWMSNDNTLMDTLATIANSGPEGINPVVDTSTNGVDLKVLDFLKQGSENGTNSSNITTNNASTLTSQHQPTMQPLFQEIPSSSPPPSQSAPPSTKDISPSYGKVSTDSTSYKHGVSYIQHNNKFVIVAPSFNSNVNNKPALKRTKFKEPIFVTESPQSYRNRIKINTNSSGDDNSDDEATTNMNSSTSSTLKSMTPKERRQWRNKISARNFRVRRKEYLSQLEERVEEQDKIIADLKKENDDLRKVNAELLKQLFIKPVSPPTSTGDEAMLSYTSVSGSESQEQQSPNSNSSVSPFTLDNLYDFTHLEQQPPSLETQTQQATLPSVAPQMTNPENLFFLHHAAMPDWDLPRILGDKVNIVDKEQHEREVAQRLMRDYPLLAPALISLVLHHTVSMEYVANLAKEFSNGLETEVFSKSDDDQDTLLGDDVDDLKNKLDSLHIMATERQTFRKNSLQNDTKASKNIKAEQTSTLEKKDPSDEELVRKMLTEHFQYYVFLRATGMSHDEIMERNRPCLLGDTSHCRTKMSKLKLGLKQENKKSFQTIQSFSRVAGELLKNPQRMTHVRAILRKEVCSKQTRQAVQAMDGSKIPISPSKTLRIAH
ncbi:hypothetical protein BDF20DRAFT_499606 [Mycotypha africana]|uniref:uncharacterized protein n=1 Tax=Mycotypha africana TaxID=64632 RepID=UPI002301DAC1|nr:uncharacterized protein BDF20DRAFT_499606 [Mycotypha africana]KAI8979377.1 hypothetical protein BDF20DRAFT_499606 [Mycotypha africana]